MYYASMTAVRDGVEYSRDITDKYQDTFYPRVVGMVQGIVQAGYTVTNLETKED